MVACRFLLSQQSFLSLALPFPWAWVHRSFLCSIARLLFKLIGFLQIAIPPSCTVALIVATEKNQPHDRVSESLHLSPPTTQVI